LKHKELAKDLVGQLLSQPYSHKPILHWRRFKWRRNWQKRIIWTSDRIQQSTTRDEFTHKPRPWETLRNSDGTALSWSKTKCYGFVQKHAAKLNDSLDKRLTSGFISRAVTQNSMCSTIEW